MTDRAELVEAGKQALTDAWSRGVLLSQDEPGGKWHMDFGKFTATVLDAVEEKIHADCPRVEIDAALGEPTMCQVWIGGRRVFNGVDLGTAMGRRR